MTPRLIIFFFLTGWAYMALVLLYRNGRASLGRAVQGMALAALTGLLLVFYDAVVAAFGGMAGRFGVEAEDLAALVLTLGLAALFVLTGFAPPVLRRRAVQRAAFGQERAARRLHRLADWISWQKVSQEARALNRAQWLMMKGRAEEARAVLDDAMRRARPGAAWGQLAAQKIDIHNTLHAWEEAKQTFELLRRECPAQVTSEALYGVSRAYLELGETLEGIRCIEDAEAQRERTSPLGTQRFMAFVAAFAMTGQADLLRELFDDPGAPTHRLPPAVAPYWMGVARAAAGDPEGARELFGMARAKLDWDDVAWSVAIQQRMKEAESLGPPPEEARLEARALAKLWSQAPPVHPLTYGRATPWASVALIAANVAVWAAVLLWPSDPFHEKLVLFGANVPQWVRQGQFWRLAAAMFLHAGPLHLFLNMYALYMFGGFLERAAGRSAMLALYVAGGLVASWATAFLSPYPMSVGASGAVLALLGAALVFVLARPGYLPPRARRLYMVNFGFLAAMSVAVGLFVPGVDNYAHAGGTLAGMALGALLVQKANKGARRLWVERALAGAAMAALLFWMGQAGLNAARGGYPDAVPRVRRAFPEAGVSAELPKLWERRVVGDRAVFMNAIVDRRRNAMHAEMQRYLDAVEIRRIEPEAPPPDEAPDEAPREFPREALDEALPEPPGEAPEETAPPPRFEGAVEISYLAQVGGEQYRVVFLAGSRQSAERRQALYREILQSLRPL